MLHRLKRRKGRLKQRSCQKKRKMRLMRSSHLKKEKNLRFSQKVRLLKIPDQHENSRRSRSVRQKMERATMRKKRKRDMQGQRTLSSSRRRTHVSKTQQDHAFALYLHDILHMLRKASVVEAVLQKFG